ncbi:class II aldolase/adducin family protein, partial [Pseudomonas aeruginosa]
PVPCAGSAHIGTEQIGEQVMRFIDQCPAVLLRKHGVFTVGASIEKALKAAVADEFGGPVPCAGYAHIGTEQIGEQVMRFIDQ